MVQIQKTRDYKIFGTMPGNRNISPDHVKKLTNSILTNNLLYANPIIVDEAFRIIDGQHRLEVAKNNKLDIYYMKLDQEMGNSAVDDMTRLNDNVWAWTQRDWLEHYIKRGFTDYEILKQFAENYRMPLGVSMALLTDFKYTSHSKNGEKITTDFKTGKFRILAMKRAQQMAEWLWEVEPYTEKGVITDRAFIFALKIVYKKFKHKKLMNKLRQVRFKIGRRTLQKDYLRQLEDVASYRSHGEVRFT